MKWQRSYGKVEVQLRQRMEQEGKPPPALLAKPVLGFKMADYLEAFHALERRRQAGYASMQPLSTAEILAYGMTHGFKSSLAFFFKVISALDDYALEEQAKKDKAERAKRSTQKPQPKRRRR